MGTKTNAAVVKPINILLADDHQMILDGLKSLLASSREYKVAGTALNGQRAMEMIDTSPLACDVLITDISMPLLSGIDLCRMVKTSHPRILVLVLSMYSSQAAVQDAVMAEADGYILKNTGRAELFSALERIAAGGTYFSEDTLQIIQKMHQKDRTPYELKAMLGAAELDILSLIVKGWTNAEIAIELSISKELVGSYRVNILDKCGCMTSMGLTKWAVRNGVNNHSLTRDKQ